MTEQLTLLPWEIEVNEDDPLTERARRFCEQVPHRELPYARRDWGGPLHSLCSYQGKLKPAIAHFLIAWFTKRADVILDPLSGVGTVPLEARRLGRSAIGNDLSPLAYAVTRAKLEPFDVEEVWRISEELERTVYKGPGLTELTTEMDVEFGLNRSLREYFHPDTLREVLIARRFFLANGASEHSPAREVVLSSLLHILHGNRPYALSRRSHPVTPFAPSGPYEYRPLTARLVVRLRKIVPFLATLAESCPTGRAIMQDFRNLELSHVDAIVTSPPFMKSVRFWSSNWMRLWFCGWNPEDFQTEPARYLESEQEHSADPYGEFARVAWSVVRSGGLLVMHLGRTSNSNMAEAVTPFIEKHFDVFFLGSESVEDGESHGLRDKGATIAHQYLFARRP